jgi:two-component system NtrC family response regulator
VAEKRELGHKSQAIKKRLEGVEGASDLIGDSPKMQQVKRLVAKVAPTDSTVLILGETGTGKELVARAVHCQSLRAEKPFVPINCGALPENLIESELFGHRKGAFTGADEHRTGLFEVADGGTVFLDEIGELPKSLQAKLRRFLESGEIRRVGDNAAFTCDVRVVCATNRHLDEMVAADQFREDLWYRINTFEIEIPPLRERAEDIPRLARHFALRCGARAGKDDEIFTPEAIEALCSHHWPGNVRELANAIEHAMILCDRLPIGLEQLPHRFSARRATVPMPRSASSPTFTASLREREMQAILEVLDRHNGNKPKAAEELGISVKTLYNKLNQTGTMSKTG